MSLNILFTGGSSFTGCWFIRELVAAGHRVTSTFGQTPSAYADPLRRRRVEMSLKYAESVFNCRFGDETFLQQLRGSTWDLLCHHGADVSDYKSEDFDVAAAVANNTRNLRAVLQALTANGQRRPAVIVTGSVFENDEGAGSADLAAFSPYGLSKQLSYQVFRYHTQRAGVALGKFVIPNPFGPLEEPRFTDYLVRNWYAGKVPTVNTPDYVRDNIHVSLLALAYRDFAVRMAGTTGLQKLNPSGYVESQGAFAQRFSAELRRRLPLGCELELKNQREFPEPPVRINTDRPDAGALGWDEQAAWDDVAVYYTELHRA